MADTRTFEERQRDLIGVENASVMIGTEQLENMRRTESKLRADNAALKRENERLAHIAKVHVLTLHTIEDLIAADLIAASLG